MTDKNAVITADKLVKTFGSNTAVDGASLHLKQGEFLCLLGPSGCGKTTVLRLIAGLETPDDGRMTINGRLASEKGRVLVSPQERGVGMVFQEYALFPHLNVKQNVAFGLHNSADSPSRVREVLRLVEMEKMGYRMPHQLSGGQKQRVALARALAPQPQVVLMDEPFSNLDASLRQMLRREVRSILSNAGVSVIFVTHDQQEALTLSDRVAIMMRGDILQTSTPGQLYRRPATRLLANFIGETNFLPAQVHHGKITCELGEFASTSDRLPQGRVQAMFRPEQLQIKPDSTGNGRVVMTEYFGHGEKMKVKMSSGGEVTLRRQVQKRIHPDARVQVTAKTSPVVYSECGNIIK